MARKNGKYICNRCGCVIDAKSDLDCTETKMFLQRNISEIPEEPDTTFSRVDKAAKLHLCGKCNNMLLSHYVYGFEIKNPPISEELVRCEDCRKFLTSECLLAKIERGNLEFIERRRDFFCGYWERSDENF